MAVKNLYPKYVRTETYEIGEYATITKPNNKGVAITSIYQANEPVSKYESPTSKTNKWRLVVNFAQSSTDININYQDGGIQPSLNPTGVIAGTYTNATVTVDANGRIISISNGSSGGSTWTTVDLTNADSPYIPANNSNFFLICDTTGGPITITTSTVPKNGDVYNIINDAGSNNITFTPVLPLLVGQGQAIQAQYDGTKWRVIVYPTNAP